jgi:hypothetical protein
MKDNRSFLFLILAVSLIMSCICPLFGPSLSESRRVGRYLSVSYPEDWYTEFEYDTLLISPDRIDVEDLYGNLRSPIFIVGTMEEWWGSDWYREASDPDEFLDDIADEFDIRLRSTETFERGGTVWWRATFQGEFMYSSRDWEGWAAVEVDSHEGAFVLAAAPEDQWSEFDSFFEAMLKAIEFND